MSTVSPSRPFAAREAGRDESWRDKMLRLFPRNIDNVYPGYWPGAWIFGLVVAGRLAMGINGTFNPAFVAANADGIPFSTYPAPAVQTVIALFALLSLLNLMLAVLGGVVLIRYRAMIPFVFLLFLARSFAGDAVLAAHPLVSTASSSASNGDAFVLGLLALTALGFVLSLMPKSGKKTSVGNVA